MVKPLCRGVCFKNMDSTIKNLEEVCDTLQGILEKYRRLDSSFNKEEFFLNAFDRKEIYIIPVPIQEDYNARFWQVALTEEEIGLIKESVLRRLSDKSHQDRMKLLEMAKDIENAIEIAKGNIDIS